MTAPRYTTLDPYLSGFLLYSGATLLGFQRLSPKRVEYAFAPNQELHFLLRQYWREYPIPITPAKLFREYRNLKLMGIARR